MTSDAVAAVPSRVGDLAAVRAERLGVSERVTSTAKRKGDNFELEVQGSLRDLLGYPARRALGAGRRDDIGDITGLPDTVIQCANYADIGRAIREKLPKCLEQQERAGATFGATFVRRRGGGYVVVLSPDQFATLWREAQPLRAALDRQGQTG